MLPQKQPTDLVGFMDSHPIKSGERDPQDMRLLAEVVIQGMYNIYILFPYTDTQILRICTYCIYINIRIYFLTGDVCNNMEISNDSQPQPGLREPIQIAKS